jgi:hypothetical protein
MNRLNATFIVIACALPSLASAGEIYGTITSDAGPVGEGTLVEATCKVGKHGPARTDKAGKYRLVISETGKCTLSVTRDGATASLDVVSFDDAAQVDVALKSDAAGKLTARRK